MIKDHDHNNTRAKTIKFLEESTGINLHDLEFGNGLDIIDQQHSSKRKIDQLGLIKS